MLRTVTIDTGVLQGVACGDPRITVFKGVPYAAPPTGELRWRPPQPCAPWQGLRKADRFAPMAIQPQPGADPNDFFSREFHPASAELPMSEDCLYLNVWTPARSAGEALPVLFYIHGGGLWGGFSYEMAFDGERLARKGCILVTVGYRLGPLGFFAHPDLTQEDPQASQGNGGFLDQLFALQWVQRNIHAFGGDPRRVTIAGQSAGAGSVTALVYSPMARGLFHGAVMMSGGGLQTWGRSECTLRTAQEEGQRLLDALHVSTVAEARKLPGLQILQTCQALQQQDPAFTYTPSIVVDGVFMEKTPQQIIQAGELPDIPFLMGACRDEGKGFYRAVCAPPMTAESFRAKVIQDYGAKAPAFLKAANIRQDSDLIPHYDQEAYHVFLSGQYALAQALCRLNRRVYMYLFDAPIPGDDAGSYHGSDLWFFFDSLPRSWRPFAGVHYDLARQISSHLVRFAAAGDPNGADANGRPLLYWPVYTPAAPLRMRFCCPSEVESLAGDELLALHIACLLGDSFPGA